MQQSLPGMEPDSEERQSGQKLSIRDVLTSIDKPGSLFEDCLILTPNQPCAQQLRRIRLESLGVKRTTGGKIKVLNAWLMESIAKISSRPLASENQLLLLWQIALEKAQSRFPDLTPRTLAPQALSAWQNLKRYQISLDELRSAEIGQLVRFSDSVKDFESLLSKKKLSTIELEIERRLQDLEEDLQSSSEQICLYAFIDQPPPLFQRWLERCFEKINTAEYAGSGSYSDYGSRAETLLYPAANESEELSCAGRWAARILEENPSARVGIMHTNLGQELNRSTRLIKKHLPDGVGFSASLRLPLSDIGQIACALDLLRLNQKEIDISQARRLIQSPFWSNFQTEYGERAAWERDLCDLQSRQVRSQQIRELLEGQSAEPCNVLTERLLKFADAKRRKSDRLSPLAWADLFHDQLEILGWPGAESHNLEPSILDAWYDVLQDFAQLGSVAETIELGQAQQLLQRCCDKRRTDAGAAHAGVRLLDTIEGAADYTHLWVTNMSSDQWPGAVEPNPLLPASLQHKHGLPRSSAEQETQLAQRLIDRVANAATQTIFSYAKTVDDLEQKPSALLPALSVLEILNDDQSSDALIGGAKFEWIDTEFAPPLAGHEKQVPGGTSLLRSMAASPFDAFAQWRLGAIPLPEPKTGLDAAERGTLVHWVMDSVWKDLESSDALKAKADSELEALCEAKAIRELQRWQGRFGWLSHAHQELEISRLAALAVRWLAIEIERPPFVVKESETRLEAQLGELHFNLRLDRLDELADGSRLLIDYKTGQGLSPKSWLELPPAEPQLPLYAISLAEPPDAICFAQIRPDQMRFIGIGEKAPERGFSEIEQWPELLALWRKSLTELAEDYAQGLARADETNTGFGRADPFAPLNRMTEHEALMNRRAEND